LKLLVENIGKTLEDVGVGNAILNRTPITKEIRASIDKGDCITFKSFCTAKAETMIRTKRQPTEWEKIFASYSSNKGLISRT
jgi:hypothetical protein